MSSYDRDEDIYKRPRRVEKDYYKKYKNRIYDIVDEDEDVYDDYSDFEDVYPFMYEEE